MPQPAQLLHAAASATRQLSPEAVESLARDAVVIVSVPRAGSTLLFEQMQRLPGALSIGGESHAIFNAFPHLRAENAALDSGSLNASHADEQTCDAMRRCFLFLSRDDRGRPYLSLADSERPAQLTLLEKTPRNALNIPFLLRVFPRARFVFLHRQPRQNIASIIDAWTAGLETGRFVTFRDLPGWDRAGWCFLLPPGWRDLVGKSLADIAAFQWSAGNRIVLDELEKLDAQRWTAVSYEQLLRNPTATLAGLADFAGIGVPSNDVSPESLRLSRTTLSPPHPDKWKRHEVEIERVRETWEPVAGRIEAL